jgi:hypothetical protein
VKLAVAYFIPVFADEAYYYIWSLRPQLSYFDHPPLVSWLIALGHFFLPEGNPLSLRISFIIASFFTSLVWLRILKNQKFSTSAIESFLILLFLNPLLGPGSVVATPDVPLVLFWSLSYLAFTEIFSSKSKFALYLNYAFLGMSLGLGFCSKYHIVLFVISGLIYLCFNQNYKKLNFLGVFLTLLFGFLFSLPVLIWNMENDWASFAYQLKHGFGKINYDWRWTMNYYLGQIALMGPLVFFSLFQKRQEKNNQVFALTQVGFFTTSSFKAIVEANWPITSHLHATAHFSENAPSKKLKFTYIYWVVIYALMIVFFNTSAGQKTLRNQYRATQMDQLVALVEKYQPLYGPSYQISSLISWRSHQFIPKLNGLSRFDFFDTLPESNPTDRKIFALKHFDSIWPDKYKKYNKTKLESFDNLQIELYQLSYD